MVVRFLLLAFLFYLPMTTISRGEDVDEASPLTPNQQRRIVKVNQDLPKDIVDHEGDSSKVTELRGLLREAYAGYREAVRQFGTPTKESRQAAQHVLEAQTALHKQFVKEEAIPAVAAR